MTRKKYKGQDGASLTIIERGDYYYIAWVFPDDDFEGACLGEDTVPEETPKEQEDWEHWMAQKVAAPLAELQETWGFAWTSLKKARAVLRDINEALLSGDAPWPDWAVKAKSEGWTPPKNWRP